jgi:hypothetical protein
MLKRFRENGPLAIAGAGTVGFLVGLLLIAQAPVSIGAMTAAVTMVEQRDGRGAVTARAIGSKAGLVLNFIKPEKTGDFEAVVARVREALQKSDRPERKQQAARWKVYRATEPAADGSVLYVFAVHPAVPGADDAVSTILAEGFPAEIQALNQLYADAYAPGHHSVDLTLVSGLAE